VKHRVYRRFHDRVREGCIEDRRSLRALREVRCSAYMAEIRPLTPLRYDLSRDLAEGGPRLLTT